MKDKTNGATPRAAKTSTINSVEDLIPLKRLACCREDFIQKCTDTYVHGGELEAKLDKAGIEWDDLPRPVQVMVMEEKKVRATVKCELDLPPWMYGLLCAAAAVHGFADHREALKQYLECTVMEWSNEGYILD
jgi:hypothetical protein